MSELWKDSSLLMGIKGSIRPSPFIANIEHFGLAENRWVVLDLLPDSGDTVIGRLMADDGSVYRFDFDLSDCSHSRLDKVDAQLFRLGFRNEAYAEEMAGRAFLGIEVARGE